MALSWVIGTLPLPILKFSTFQSEGEHVLGAEETMQKRPGEWAE